MTDPIPEERRNNSIAPCNRRWSFDSNCWEVYGGGGVWMTLKDWDDSESPPTNYSEVV